jgi:glycerol-3-phosphate dehydrogenase
VPRERIGNRHAVVLRAPADGRVMFVIPWGEHALIGTTDTDHPGSPDRVVADRADVDYLLEAVNVHFPAARLAIEDVVSTYAGLRPLVAPPAGSVVGPSGVSREEEIFTSPAGLISLAGGKLTTYRRVAIDVVGRVVTELRRRNDRRPFPPSATHRKPLLGGGAAPAADAFADAATLAPDLRRHLEARYGSRVHEILTLLDGQGPLRRPLVSSAGDLRGEVRVATAAEMAVRVEDVLRRRLHVGLKDRAQGLGVLADVAALMASVLGWDDGRRRTEEAVYRAQVERERRAWGGR